MIKYKISGLVEKGIIAIFLVMVFWGTNSSSSEKISSVPLPDSSLDLLIKKRINEWKTPSKIFIRGERIYAAFLVEKFYKGRNYQPAWIQNGHLMQAETLIKAIEEAHSDGLTPDYYHLSLMTSLLDQFNKRLFTDLLHPADLDILLTDAFLTLGCHLSGGCVNPVTLEAEWFAKHGNVDVPSLLNQALNKQQIREALVRLRPEQGSYGRLKEALARYRELSSKGKWPPVSAGPALKRGFTSGRVLELRKRLALSGDLEADGANRGDLFDEKLEKSVITFQKRHGLEADGIVGGATLQALNTPLEQRIRQMELNLERLRWILGNVEERFIVVNIANFELDVIENGKSILSMKVVVGKPFWRTPVFTAKMTHLIINPSWYIPQRIAEEEILAKIKEDPHYLARQHIKVLRNRGSREEEIDPATIDWSKINDNKLGYKFRQEPGVQNPLGRIKFMFPNKFDVYLHDTSGRGLFSKNVRTFSHGCTRIEKPVELGEYVLRGDPNWTKEKLLAALERGAEQKVMIPHPLNVHFLYLTAWVDEGGILQFRNDIYGRDGQLDEALRKKPSLH